MKKSVDYQISVKNGRLVLRTSSFRAERGSVLHSGIYNRELTSSLAASALLALIFVALVLAGVDVSLIYVIPAAVFFAGFFIFFRKALFYEESLDAVIDRASGLIEVTTRRFPVKTESFALSDLAAVRQGHVVITPENPDGVQFVEKIALQHGTVIPGFGEVREFHTVELEFKNGRMVRVFSSEQEAEAARVTKSLKEYVGEGFA
jgi:hypothetical protein